MQDMKYCGACGHTVHGTTLVEPPPIVNLEEPSTAQDVVPPPIAASGSASSLSSFELPEIAQSSKPPIVDSRSIESSIIQGSGEENDNRTSALSMALPPIPVQPSSPKPPAIASTPKDPQSTTEYDLPSAAAEEGDPLAQSSVTANALFSNQSEGNAKDTPADRYESSGKSREEPSDPTERRAAQVEPDFSLTRPMSLSQCRRCGADITREGGTVLRRGIGYCFFCGSVVQPYDASGVGGSSGGRTDGSGSVDSTSVNGGDCAGSMGIDASSAEIVAGALGSPQIGSNPTTVVHVHTYVPQPTSENHNPGSLSPFGAGVILGISRSLLGILFFPIVAIVLFVNWVNTPNNRR